MNAFRLAYLATGAAWLYVLVRDTHVWFERMTGVIITDTFFPLMYRDAIWAQIALLLFPVFCVLGARRVDAWWPPALMALTSFFLMTSPWGVGAQLFASSFLVSVWLTASAYAALRDEDTRAPVFWAGMVMTVVFTGATAGKLTKEYWSGEAMYYLWVSRHHSFQYVWMREHLDHASLLYASMLLGRATIFFEGVMAFVPWLTPRKWAMWLWAAGLVCMVVTTHYSILEAVGPLIGMCVAGAWITRQEAHADGTPDETPHEDSDEGSDVDPPSDDDPQPFE